MTTPAEVTTNRSTRLFLPWDAPCLPQATDALIDRGNQSAGLCRLDRTLIVLPGRQAGRVLLELLVRGCQQRGLTLMPPRIVTPGDLVDALLPPTEPVASTLECHLAWAELLRAAPAADLRVLLAVTPDEDDLRGWHAIAASFHYLWTELATAGRTFADAADRAGRMELNEEADRWTALEDLHARMLAQLRERGLRDPDDRRRTALRSNVAASTRMFESVILIGVVELSAVQRLALTRVDSTVLALIHAPEDCAEGFDEFGAVRPDWWHDQPLPLPDESIIVADRLEDQAQTAVRQLRHWPDRSPEEVTIGFGEPALADQLEHAAAWAGLALHRADGAPLTRSAPFRLLRAAADWLDDPRFANFAALLRHPDLERWLQQSLAPTDEEERDQERLEEARQDWLSLLDRSFADHLHERLSRAWLDKPGRRRQLRRVYDAVARWLAPLQPESGQRAQPLGAWVAPILAVLSAIYDKAEVDSETFDACIAIRDALLPFNTAASELQPPCTSAAALRFMLTTMERVRLPSPVRADQIEALGWLELHLDPAPVLILAGVNDGAIPESVTGDAFLPDQLRNALGLMSNRRRFGRDRYLLRAITESRESLILIAGRTGTGGDPLLPSRLLLACPREKIPARIARLTDAQHALRWSQPLGAPQPGKRSRFIVPEAPSEPVELESLPVTAFALYLQCPYRFWLQRMLGLCEFADEVAELDPMGFGILAHDVLQRFGADTTASESADPEHIRAFLLDTLNAVARDRFGEAPAPAVRVQLARLARRLEAFAEMQATTRQSGWRIIATEYTLPETAMLDLPDQAPLRVTAKIDRIDQHDSTGALRIIDYKTGESGWSPFQTHHGASKYRPDSWIDLQLPLYDYLYRRAAEPSSDQIELGYIVLPKKPEDVSFRAAAWTREQLDEAIDTAREVVRHIRAGHFEINPEYRSPFDSFARICQTTVLGGVPDNEGGAGEDAG